MSSYESSANPQTFSFADLAGFTALTEAHGDERAAALATEFLARMKERASGFARRERASGLKARAPYPPRR